MNPLLTVQFRCYTFEDEYLEPGNDAPWRENQWALWE